MDLGYIYLGFRQSLDLYTSALGVFRTHMTKAGMSVLKTAQPIVVQMAVLCRLPIEVFLCLCISHHKSASPGGCALCVEVSYGPMSRQPNVFIMGCSHEVGLIDTPVCFAA